MAFGAYGKIAGLGDFLRFGLPRDFVQGWDGWLQSGISEAERKFGDHWSAYYNSAPMWRFGLPPETVGEAAMIGILMPSVDRVGRRFPLTFATPVEADVSLLSVYLGAEALFAGLEDIALQTLGGEMTPSELENMLADLSVADAEELSVRDTGQLVVRERSGRGNAVYDLAASLAEPDERAGYWSAQVLDRSQAFAAGVPDAGLFLHLVKPFEESAVPP